MKRLAAMRQPLKSPPMLAPFRSVSVMPSAMRIIGVPLRGPTISHSDKMTLLTAS